MKEENKRFSHERNPIQVTTISKRLSFPNHTLLFDLEKLYQCLQTVPDRRKRRGRRYPLAALLMIGVLAKLAGQDSSRAISHWAKLRKLELSRLFQLKRQTMPHPVGLTRRDSTLQQH